MAYATKYTASFVDVNNITWDIDFLEDGFGGSETSLTPGATPFTITWNQSDKYQPIIGSTVDIQLKYESAIDSLYTEDSEGIRVRIQRNSSNYWFGFLSPGQYYRNFNKPVHFITLTASDRLGELKDIKFEDGSGNPYYYAQTEIAAISNILLKTGLSKSIYDAIQVYETDYDATAADSPLAQTYIWPEQYWDEITDERSDCYTVLSDILKKYGATVRQSNDAWYLLRPNAYSADANVYYRVYTSAGVYSSNSSFTSYNSIGSSMYYIRANQELYKMRSYGSAEITLAPRMRNNLLKNGSFESWTYDTNHFHYWGHSSTVPNYNNSADTSAITLGSNESAGIPTYYLYTRVYLYKTKSVRLTLEYKCAYTGSPTHAKIHVGMIVNGNYFATNGADTWSTTSYVGGTSNEAYDLIADSKASMTDYETLVIEPSKGPYESVEGGYGHFNWLDIRLYEFHNETTPAGGGNYVAFRQAYLEVQHDGSIPSEKIYIYDNTENTTDSIYSDTLALGDSFLDDLTSGNDDLFAGITVDTAEVGALRTSGAETDTWYIKGHNTTATTPEPIAELLARQIVEGHYKSLDVIRGSIRSAYTFVPHLAFEDSDFTDAKGFNKRFFPKGISYDARLNEYSGEWVECPATYTDEEMEWDSHDCGGDATITGNQIEINDWSSGGTGYFAYFDDYTAVAGETVRVVANLQDDGGAGSVHIPQLYIGDGFKTRDWGLNYYTVRFATAGAKYFRLYASDDWDFNCTVTFDIYSLTGV